MEWDFGDGTTSSDAAPTHRYTIAGSYDIQLIVSGPGGLSTSEIDGLITVDPGALARLGISPESLSISVQEGVNFIAVGRDDFDNVVPSTFDWTVDGAAGSIDGNGLFTAGTATGLYTNAVTVKVTGDSSGRQAVSSITVTPGPIVSVMVQPPSAILDIGDTQSFSFRAFDAFENETTDALIAWAVSPDVGTIDGDGKFTAGTNAGSFPGSLRVEAVSGATRSSASVDVVVQPDPLAAVTVTPSQATITGGASQTFNAGGFDEYGNAIPELSFIWKSTGGAISQNGVYSAGQDRAYHTVTASALYEGRSNSGSADVQVLSTTPGRSLKIADLPWESARVQNGVLGYILENGYGYPTELVIGSTDPLFQALINHEVDISMEIWVSTQQDDWYGALELGQITTAGKSLEDNWQSTFVVPTYMVEDNPELTSVYDIKNFSQLWVDESSSGKAVLTGCVVNWKCSAINQDQVDAYGLSDVIEIRRAASGDELFSSLRQAYGNRQPWLGYLWGPIAISEELDLTLLQEPPADECSRPGSGCAFPLSQVMIGLSTQLESVAPEVIEFLRLWEWNRHNQIFAESWYGDNKNRYVDPFGETAVYVLKNREFWTEWVPEDIKQHILLALSQES